MAGESQSQPEAKYEVSEHGVGDAVNQLVSMANALDEYRAAVETAESPEARAAIQQDIKRVEFARDVGVTIMNNALPLKSGRWQTEVERIRQERKARSPETEPAKEQAWKQEPEYMD